MKKPVIWHFNGKWWCGRYQGVIMKVPVADILGSGATPNEAYSSWVRCKWGVARAVVKRRTQKPTKFAEPESERCHRCYTILTSEDKYHYSISCENCQCDMEWEDHERDQPIKSAYWRWRAICFAVRWLWCSVAGYRSLRLWLLSRPVDASRPKFQANRRK